MPTNNLQQSEQLNERDRALLHHLINEECTFRMSDALIDTMLNLGTVRSLKRRECIIRAGEVNDDIYIIIDGIMRSWYRDGEQEVTQAFGPPGTLMQSHHSYYAGEPASVNYEACCGVKLLHIKRADFDALIESNPEFARWNLRLVQNQLYHYEIKNRVINGPARERYERLIWHRPDIVRNVPLKIIATYLGVTPEYLSKIRRQIVQQK